jgi:hypothetical protein
MDDGPVLDVGPVAHDDLVAIGAQLNQTLL